MDVLETYGFMVIGAVICLVAPIVFSIVWMMAFSELNYEVPGPWVTVAMATALAAPVVAAVGAAVLVGPSSDLVNFIRAVGGVLAGLATYFGGAMVGLPNEHQQFRIKLQDGRVLTDADALEYDAAHRGEVHQEWGWWELPGWQPSAMLVARFVLSVCIVSPVAGVVVAIVIADWT